MPAELSLLRMTSCVLDLSAGGLALPALATLWLQDVPLTSTSATAPWKELLCAGCLPALTQLAVFASRQDSALVTNRAAALKQLAPQLRILWLQNLERWIPHDDPTIWARFTALHSLSIVEHASGAQDSADQAALGPLIAACLRTLQRSLEHFALATGHGNFAPSAHQVSLALKDRLASVRGLRTLVLRDVRRLGVEQGGVDEFVCATVADRVQREARERGIRVVYE